MCFQISIYLFKSNLLFRSSKCHLLQFSFQKSNYSISTIFIFILEVQLTLYNCEQPLEF